jgi:predicted RNA-binding Zn-ribbon protein involved in translation (DUF1610 family)
MGFTIDQECPQCGAPIELDETDHLLQCPFCSVRNFLFTPDYFRFVLPHKAANREIFYAPYLRFRGNVYFCKGLTVDHHVVDITHLGLRVKGIPESLGLRPQTMRLKFITPSTAGSFLRFLLKADDILTTAGNLPWASSAGEIFHRAYIGETLSLIYLPLYAEKDRLFDAVLNKPIARLPGGQEVLKPVVDKNPRWKITFMATLCPQCGWNLEGERDSVVLICNNCDTAWEAREGKFIRVGYGMVQGQVENDAYLPFWKISTAVEGLEINSIADFMRVTNQPRVEEQEWENDNMSFWSPAFKIRPKVFLNLSRQFTISQRQFQTEATIPKKTLYPVTLPLAEAAQSMKITLASSALNKVLPYLPRITFSIKDSTLVYIPFKDTGHEMIHRPLRLSITKSALAFGRKL